MSDYSELKRLADGMKGWDKMTECWPCDENGPDWQVGRLDEDDNRWPLLTIDTEQYDQEQDAAKIAQYYAAANPAVVLALIAENEALLEMLSQQIYERWSGEAGYVPWVRRGNSLRQDEARRIARSLMSKEG